MRRFVVTLQLVLLALMPAGAAASGPAVTPAAGDGAPARTARVVVDFAAAPGQPSWFAEALELETVDELARFRRIEIADGAAVDTSACRPRTSRCLTAAYGSAGVDVVVLGVLDGAGVDYEIDETWSGARAASGRLDTSERASAERMQPQLAALARALVETGGVLDRLPEPAAVATNRSSISRAASAGTKPSVESPPGLSESSTSTGASAPGVSGPSTSAGASPSRVSPLLTRVRQARVALGAARAHVEAAIRACPKAQLVLVAWILLFVTPAIVLRMLRGRTPFAPGARPRSAGWAAAATLVLSAALVAVSLPVPLPLPPAAWRALELARVAAAGWPALVPAVGGVAWGAVILVAARLVLPPLPGVERVRHDALWAVVEAYVAVVLQRLVVAGLALLPLGLVAWVALAAGAGAELTLLVVVPLAALAGWVWLLLLVDALTIYLDRELVSGGAADHDPWHRALVKYFRGYARRTGLDVDPRVLDRLLFLPGKDDGVVSYGGGWARPRIVVGPELREVALGELAEEAEPRVLEHRLGEWPAGLVLPSGSDAPARERKLRKAVSLRAAQARGPAAHAPGRVVGESATLLGWVLPIPSSETVPLVSNDSDDFSVVRELLTEHYAAFEKNVDDEEYDDTDPTQKDFLYGALLVEVGAVLRRDTLLGTLGLALTVSSARARGVGPLVGRTLSGLQRRFGARWTAVLGDAFAALNQGRDHLIQYLFFLRARTLMPLTARAPLPTMLRTSKELLDAIAAERPEGLDRQLFRATPRNRLVWLSRLFFEPIPDRRERRLRVAAVLAVVLALGGSVAVAARGARLYHPVYVERMKAAVEGEKSAGASQTPAQEPAAGAATARPAPGPGDDAGAAAGEEPAADVQGPAPARASHDPATQEQR